MDFLGRVLATAIALGYGAGSNLGAATLSSVPMQGGMVMQQVAYHAANRTLTFSLDLTPPQLTPLLVSNPGDSFNPADPWYDFLDPSRMGLAFSRRCGFAMDGASDSPPPGTAIWIRKLSGSQGLNFYRYRSGAPKVWDPIFGTADSTNVFQWDGTMFHAVVTALPGTATYAANFEAFLVNTNTEPPMAGASTGSFTLTWTNIPDGRPVLGVATTNGPPIGSATKMIIDWPSSSTNYVLETAGSVPSSTWTVVTNAPLVIDGQATVVLDQTSAQKFFRMRLAP